MVITSITLTPVKGSALRLSSPARLAEIMTLLAQFSRQSKTRPRLIAMTLRENALTLCFRAGKAITPQAVRYYLSTPLYSQYGWSRYVPAEKRRVF